MDMYLNFGSLIQLPVLPSSFRIKGGMNNTEVNINNIGTINLLGKRGLKEIELSSFFPAQNYEFCRCVPQSAYGYYCKKITEAMEENTIGTILITDTSINMQCTIASFEYGEEDNSGDVFYTLSLKEYRNVTASRVSKSTRRTTYKTEKGDTFYKISRQFFGNSAYADRIAAANRKKVSYKFKKSMTIIIPAVGKNESNMDMWNGIIRHIGIRGKSDLGRLRYASEQNRNHYGSV